MWAKLFEYHLFVFVFWCGSISVCFIFDILNLFSPWYLNCGQKLLLWVQRLCSYFILQKYFIHLFIYCLLPCASCLKFVNDHLLGFIKFGWCLCLEVFDGKNKCHGLIWLNCLFLRNCYLFLSFSLQTFFLLVVYYSYWQAI